jgi:hypothetical protein
MWKKVFLEYLGYYAVICLEGLRKFRRSISQDSLCPGRESKRTPPEYGILNQFAWTKNKIAHKE